MIAKFFIERPVLANVIAVLTIILGLVALIRLPVAQYPNIVPPTVQVTARYPGASAATVVRDVALPIEQKVNGVEGMIYMSSDVLRLYSGGRAARARLGRRRQGAKVDRHRRPDGHAGLNPTHGVVRALRIRGAATLRGVAGPAREGKSAAAGRLRLEPPTGHTCAIPLRALARRRRPGAPRTPRARAPRQETKRLRR